MGSQQYQPYNHIQIVKADDVNQFGFSWGRNADHEASVSQESINHEAKSNKSPTTHTHDASLSEAYTKQVHFKSLKDILQGFSRRRSIIGGDVSPVELKRHESIEEAELKKLHSSITTLEKRLTELYREGEEQRDDEKIRLIRELEAELVSLRAKITFREKFDDSHIRYTSIRRASIKSTPDLESDRGSEDEIDFIDPTDLDLTHDDLLPAGTRLSISSFKPLSASTLFVPDPCHEQQTEQLENVIAELSEQLAHSKSALGVIKIELANLGFSSGDIDSCREVLATIRQAFRQARIDFQDVFPEQKVDNIKNSALLKLIFNHTRGILARMEEQVLRIQRQEEAIALYKAEYNGVLNKLSESDGNKVALEEQLKIVLSQKEEEIRSIEKQIRQFVQRIDKHHTSEMTISTDFGYFQDVFMQLEQRYSARIQKLKKEKEEAVSSWKLKYEKERTAKERVTQESSQKQKTIIDLQKVVASSKDSTTTIQKRLEVERQNYQSMEKKLHVKVQQTSELQEKLQVEFNHVSELAKKLDIAKDALVVQKQQHKDELLVEIEKRRNFESQLTQVTTELHGIQKTYKRQEEKISSLNSQIQSSKEHSKTLQERITSLNSSLTQKVTQIRTLETKVSTAEELKVKIEHQVRSVKEQLKSAMETRTTLERQINDKTSSSSLKIQHLESQTQELQTTVEKQAHQLTRIETEYEEEKKTSTELRTKIEKIQADARNMAQSFEEARRYMQQVQSDVMKRVMQEFTGEQQVVKERFSEVKNEYEEVMTGIEAIKLEASTTESVRTKRKKEVHTKQIKSSKQSSQSDQRSSISQHALESAGSVTADAAKSERE